MLSSHVNPEFFATVIVHSVLYFECLNTPGYSRVVETDSVEPGEAGITMQGPLEPQM